MTSTYDLIMSLNRLKECEFCGYNEYIVVLTLHHLFPRLNFKPQPDFDAEDRYLILCPTCHNLLHRGIFASDGKEIINRKICVCEVKYQNNPNIEEIIDLVREIYDSRYKHLNTMNPNQLHEN